MIVPSITRLADGEGGPQWSLVWDVGDYHFELNLFDGGPTAYFWRNRQEGTFGGTEDDHEPCAKMFNDPAFAKAFNAIASDDKKALKP